MHETPRTESLHVSGCRLDPERVQRDAGGDRDVQRIDAAADRDPHAVVGGRLEPPASGRRLRCRRSARGAAGAGAPAKASSVSDGSRGVSATIVKPARLDARQRAGQSSAPARANGTLQRRAHRRPDRLAIQRIAAGRAEQHAARRRTPRHCGTRRRRCRRSRPPSSTTSSVRRRRSARRPASAAADARAPDSRGARRSRRCSQRLRARRRRPARRRRSAAIAGSRSRSAASLTSTRLHAIARVLDARAGRSAGLRRRTGRAIAAARRRARRDTRRRADRLRVNALDRPFSAVAASSGSVFPAPQRSTAPAIERGATGPAASAIA